MSIDELSGSDLDRLAFDLGLGPENMDWNKTLKCFNFYGREYLWHPSTNIAQAVEMARRFHAYDIYYCPQEAKGVFSPCEACVEYSGVYSRVFAGADTEAEALTRACCKAAQARNG